MVLVAALPVGLTAGFAALMYPLVVPLVLVPAVILWVALWWMDRLEPEPIDARIFALAWGATVAPLVAIVVGSFTEPTFGEFVATVVGAPVSEELAKGAVLFILVRKKVIDSIIDGAMYAVAVAAGFAVLEDLLYFAAASEQGVEVLAATFIGRGLITPFAHPLFTIWMGVAAGWIVTKRPSQGIGVAVAAGSVATAIGLHALWNGSLSVAQDYPEVFILVGALFVFLFVTTVVIVSLLRRHQAQEFEKQVPELAEFTGMTPQETAMFATTKTYMQQRKRLNSRQRKKLAQLRWTLHAIGSMRQVPPRTLTEARSDAIELEHLRNEVTNLRKELLSS